MNFKLSQNKPILEWMEDMTSLMCQQPGTIDERKAHLQWLYCQVCEEMNTAFKPSDVTEDRLKRIEKELGFDNPSFERGNWNWDSMTPEEIISAAWNNKP